MRKGTICVAVIFAFMALCIAADARDAKIAGKKEGSLVSESNPQPSPSPETVKERTKNKTDANPAGESNPQPSPSPKKFKKNPMKDKKGAISESNPQPFPSQKGVK